MSRSICPTLPPLKPGFGPAFWGYFQAMSDPRQAAAQLAGHRAPQRARLLGWLISTVLWVIASDGRPLLALLSVAAAVVIRCVYVVMTRLGTGRSVFWSAWFFVVAAVCEIAWLAQLRLF